MVWEFREAVWVGSHGHAGGGQQDGGRWRSTAGVGRGGIRWGINLGALRRKGQMGVREWDGRVEEVVMEVRWKGKVGVKSF